MYMEVVIRVNSNNIFIIFGKKEAPVLCAGAIHYLLYSICFFANRANHGPASLRPLGEK